MDYSWFEMDYFMILMQWTAGILLPGNERGGVMSTSSFVVGSRLMPVM